MCPAGYIFGGVAQDIGWRVLFFLEAVVGVLIALIALLAPNVRLRGADNTAITGNARHCLLSASVSSKTAADGFGHNSDHLPA